MIARIWHGWTLPSNADAYESLLKTEIFVGMNLAGNAIKFTERGEIAISVEQSQISDAESEICNLRFAVRDTGIGIPPSVLERLFQPFAQADASMSRRFGGTGLGLSISKSLVEMMDGRIRVESEQGKGSTFYFTVRLPLAKEVPSDFEAPAAVPTAASARLRILLAEDNPANQKLAAYILQDRGHLLEIAGDGQQAIDLSEQNRYDVILMEVQMPGMDGLRATAAIRNRENGGSHPPWLTAEDTPAPAQVPPCASISGPPESPEQMELEVLE